MARLAGTNVLTINTDEILTTAGALVAVKDVQKTVIKLNKLHGFDSNNFGRRCLYDSI